jgi:hypothetical protein
MTRQRRGYYGAPYALPPTEVLLKQLKKSLAAIRKAPASDGVLKLSLHKLIVGLGKDEDEEYTSAIIVYYLKRLGFIGHPSHQKTWWVKRTGRVDADALQQLIADDQVPRVYHKYADGDPDNSGGDNGGPRLVDNPDLVAELMETGHKLRTENAALRKENDALKAAIATLAELARTT